MSFISIGELAKEKFKDILPLNTTVYSSVGFRDCVEILCGQFAAQSLHELYQHNGMMVMAALSREAYEIATLRQEEMEKAMQQMGWGVEMIRIL